MAEPVYSVLIAAYHGVTGTLPAIGPGTGYKWVVRCMDFYCGPSTPTPELFIRGNDGQAFFYATGSVTDGAYNSWRGRQVIGQAGTLQVSVVEGTWDVTISGYLLSLP